MGIGSTTLSHLWLGKYYLLWLVLDSLLVFLIREDGQEQEEQAKYENVDLMEL